MKRLGDITCKNFNCDFCPLRTEKFVKECMKGKLNETLSTILYKNMESLGVYKYKASLDKLDQVINDEIAESWERLEQLKMEDLIK